MKIIFLYLFDMKQKLAKIFNLIFHFPFNKKQSTNNCCDIKIGSTGEIERIQSEK